MTRLNYSNLPPEAQDAIQKLTGLSPEELDSKHTAPTATPSAKTSKAKPKPQPSLKKTLLILALLLGIPLLLGTIGYIICNY